MKLETINTQTTWADASNSINQNNARINEAVIRLENATYKNKGYFKTLAELNANVPSPNVGSLAYVGTSYPFAIYLWNKDSSTWSDSGLTGGDPDVNLSNYYTKSETDSKVSEASKAIDSRIAQETGYSENVVMSQKAVTKNLSELEQENENNKEVASKILNNVNNAFSRLDGLDSSFQDRNGEQLYITDKHGNILAEFNKQGINSIGFFEKGERLKQGVEGVSDKYDDGFYITDLNGNVIATIDKNGIDSVGFFEKGKKLGGGTEGILDIYDNEFHIVDAKGNIVLTVNKNGLKTIGLSTGEFKKNVWGKKVIATYGDSITALNGGDFTYPYGEEATKASWAGKVAKYFDFAKIHNRGIGSTTYKYYDANGGQVAWCKTETGEYVSRNDSYNYDNYQGNVTIPSDCTAIRGSGSSWLRIKTMFPESIKDSIDVLLIQYHNDYHQDMNTACSWVEGSSYDPEWAASEYYQTYGGDYNIQTVQGGIASTIMKFQAWMPNALIVLMTPISGVYTNGNGDVKEIENVESAKMRKLAEVVKDIAFKMSIPCIDVYGNDGINTLNHKLNGYITDGIHPYSDAGCKKIARAVISGLDSIIPNIN